MIALTDEINLLMNRVYAKTELKLSDSRSIDRNRLVEVNKKYALMNNYTQRQVTAQLECRYCYI